MRGLVFAKRTEIKQYSLTYLKDTIFNGQDRHIESSSAEIEDADVLLSAGVSFLVQTVGDGSGSGLVDDSENVKSSNHSSILGGLSLRIVEVSWDSNNGICYGLSKVGFSGLLHFSEDHGRDLFGEESLLLSFVLDLQIRC